MAGVKQTKSWFFQEVSPVKRADGTLGGIRLRSTDKPDQQTMENLLASATFSKETSDRAKLYTGVSDLSAEQGLSVLATNFQAKSNAAQLVDRSIVVQPHQLPTVGSGQNTIVGGFSTFTGDVFSVPVNSGIATRNHFDVTLSTSFVTWLESNLSSGDFLARDGSNSPTADIHWGSKNIRDINALFGTSVGADFTYIAFSTGSFAMAAYDGATLSQLFVNSAGVGVITNLSGNTGYLKSDNLTGHRICQLPNGTTILAGLQMDQTWTATQTFGNYNGESVFTPYKIINATPAYNQGGTNTADIHFLYYNPSLMALLGNHYFIESTSGKVKLGDTTASTLYTNGSLTVAGGLGIAGDIVQESTKAYYFGNTTTDGSWRITRSGNNLITQRREAGVWVTKQTITP